MANERKLIGLRLNKALYDRVVARARSDSRKPANYVEHLLHKWLMADARAESRPVAPPIDTSGLFTTRAAAPQSPATAPSKPTIRVCAKCFGTSWEDATACSECGTPFPPEDDSPPEDEDHSDEYDGPPTIAH